MIRPGLFEVKTTTHGRWSVQLGRDGHDGALIRTNGDGPEVICPVPEVIHRIAWRNLAGVRVALHFVLRWEDGTTRVVDDGDLHRPEAWTGTPMAAREPKIVHILAMGLRDGTKAMPETEGSPSWQGGGLYVPPPPFCPPGYHDDFAGDELDRYKPWRQIVDLAPDNPKIALVAGAALGGCYVTPLGREPFTLHLVGDSSQGKSTALTVAAAIWGDPLEVMGSWNKTPAAVERYLARLAVLPAVLDELGSSGQRPAYLETLMMRVAGGGGRETATRTQTATNDTLRAGRWRSVLISSGNRGLSNVSTNPGLPVRVIDLPAPITSSAAAADELQQLAQAGAGAPLRWLLEEQSSGGGGLDHMRELFARAEADLDAGRGGDAGRVARHLALCVAGAGRLGWLAGGRSYAHRFGQAALEAAREHLEALQAALEERGNMPEQLLEAVSEAAVARVYAFPTDYHYDTGETALRPIEGIDLGEGRLAVFPAAMRRIAAEAGIFDPEPGLRELARRGLLETTNADHGHLTRRIRINGHSQRVYIFRTDDQTPSDAATAPVRARPAPASRPPKWTQTGAAGATKPQASATDTPSNTTTSPNAPVAPANYETSRVTKMRAEDRLEALTRALAALGHPDLDTVTTSRALSCLESATGLSYEGPTPARAGLVWLHAINAHHSIPDLERQDTWTPERPRILFETTDPAQADTSCGALVQLDLNSAYANTAQTIELGTGAPTHILSPTRDHLKHPGFVTLEPRADWPAPFHLLEAGRPVYTGMAALLAGWLGQAPPMADAHIWTEHRRWLRPFARRLLAARAALDQQNTPEAALAVAVLKAIYSAALGGMLASGPERGNQNRTAYLRPDWLALIRAHTQMNLWRQLHQATPPPIAVATDSAFFALERPDQLPAGVTISAQPGKFKLERVAALAEPIREAIRAGKPRLVQRLAHDYQIDR